MTDYLQERKNEDIGIAKANPQIYTADKYIAGLDMIEVQDVVDCTLQKIRTKIIDKAMEAENTLKEYEGMLYEGTSNFENLKRQLSQLDDEEVE